MALSTEDIKSFGAFRVMVKLLLTKTKEITKTEMEKTLVVQ